MIKLAIAGFGNCASALCQAIAYCRQAGADAVGVCYPTLGGYSAGEIDVVAAFDVDARKVGKPLSEAALSAPNNTKNFCTLDALGDITIAPGPVLDGVSAFMRNNDPERSFVLAEDNNADRKSVTDILKKSGAEVLVIFLPVGSQEAAEFYAACALEAGVAVVNGIPVFLASNKGWASRFEAAGLPIIGDDFKAQLGATILHRTLVSLFERRGVSVDRTYQLNIGGNTDFLNMMDMGRLSSKRESKTEAVQSAVDDRFDDNDIRIGPSDYVPWLNDEKIAYIRTEGRLVGGVPMNVEIRLSVEDSANAAAMALVAIRCARIARDRGLGGAITDVSAFLFKHPPVQYEDTEAARRLEAFAAGGS